SGAMNAINAVFIMSYNINVSGLYSRHDLVSDVLTTFANVGIPEEKLFFGIQPYQNATDPATPIAVIESLGDFMKKSNYGGLFMWGIGTPGLGGYDSGRPALSASDYLSAMKRG